MSAGAFVLISAESGAESDIVKTLKTMPYVKEVTVVFGLYDVVARIEADTIDRVRDVIMHKISEIQNVRSAEIMLGAKSD